MCSFVGSILEEETVATANTAYLEDLITRVCGSARMSMPIEAKP